MDSITHCHVYTLVEAARLLKVKPVTVRRLVLRKKLPRVPFIRHIRIPCGAVERLANGAL
jgi:excisionase family DNA binding protein